jgi:hypothetical protein
MESQILALKKYMLTAKKDFVIYSKLIQYCKVLLSTTTIKRKRFLGAFMAGRKMALIVKCLAASTIFLFLPYSFLLKINIL